MAMMDRLTSRIKLDRKSSDTLVDQMINQVADMIDTGNLPVDTRLPSPVKLSKEMGIAYCTVEAAFKKLSEQGYIQRSKRGSFVSYPLVRREKVSSTATSRKIVLLFLDQAEQECLFKQKVVRGIKDVLKEPHFSLEIMRISDFQEAGQDWSQELTKRNGYDALIIDKEGVSDHESQQFAEHANTPFLLFGSMLWSFYHNSQTILPDYGYGIHQVVDHLVGLGHKQVAMLTRNKSFRPDYMKEQSLRDAMQKHGLSVDDSLIVDSVGRDNRCVAEAVGKLIEGRTNPTAIVCGDDIIAFEAIKYLNSRGIDVPRDISIAGYNDFDVCSINTPQITTVRVPMREMGQTIAEKLLERMAGKNASGIVHIPVELVVRDSTGESPHL